MSLRTTARIAASLVTLALLGLVAAPLAGADQDPYGSTTTTTSAVGEAEASCSLSLSEAKPGTEVIAKVAGVFFGEHVNILFDGVIVGSTTAPAAPVTAQSASGAVAFGGQALAAQDTVDTTTVTIKFTVPKAAVGTHLVTAVGDTFTCFCNPRGEFKVLAASSGTGGLARTGIEAALLLVIAAALLIIGRTLLDGSKRRRRRAQSDEDERDLTSVGR
jgi:hypothetical protein